MKTSKFSTKFFIACMGLTSLMVLAGTMVDMQMNSTAFMQIEESGVTTRRFDDQLWNSERFVASAERELPAAQYLGVNQNNEEKVNGDWQITRVLDDKENIIFDINRVEDSNKSLVLDFEMIATSRVRIDGDDALVFDISLLHESGKTIALFRSFGDGYEIIEARRGIASINPKAVEVEAQAVGIEKKEAKIVVDNLIEEGDSEVELTLERALNPKKSKAVLKGDQVSGNMTLRKEGDQSTITDLTFTMNGESYSADYVDMKAGGQFTIEAGDQPITGIATNNGKGGMRIRFASGPFAGAMLNFVTEEELELIQEQEAQQQAAREEALANAPEIVEQQESIENARRNAPTPVEQEEENYEESYEEGEDFAEGDEEILEEEVASYVKEKGFNFNSEPKRSVASIVE